MNTDLIIIPKNLAPIAPILTQYLSPLLIWFSDLVYERLIASEHDHLLYRLHSLLDFTELETACAAYHPGNGNGRPVIHTVPQLLRAMLVKYLYGCSLRELEEKIRCHILVKWFVGYPIFAAGPDHTTLHRFEVYLYVHHARLFFDTVLRQIDAAFPNDRRQPQLGDTFALHANAALESLIQRLRHFTQELLLAYRAADPEVYARLWAQLDEAALFGSAAEKTECYLSPQEWRQRLLQTVTAILNCQHIIRQTAVAAPVQRWLDRLDKLFDDELHLELDENGQLLHLSLLTKRGTYRLCSATDPEATIRNHGGDKKDFAYNVSVLATIHFIREIQVDTGSRPDGDAIADVLQAQRENQGFCPDKLVYDKAAGWGKIVHQVDQVTDGQTQLVAYPVLPKRNPGAFTPEDFTLSADGFSLTCPNGRISTKKYRAGSGDGDSFRYIAPQCLSCPFWQPCRGSEETPTTHKSVFISDYRAEWERLKAYSQTEAFKQDMKLRPHVERIIAGLVLHNDARQARFRGIDKVAFQARMCATAYNLKRWVSLLAEKQQDKPPKKRRRFGAPLPVGAVATPSRGEVGLVAA